MFFFLSFVFYSIAFLFYKHLNAPRVTLSSTLEFAYALKNSSFCELTNLSVFVQALNSPDCL